MLVDNLKKFKDEEISLNGTVITSLFEDGLKWVGENRKTPLFYFFIGITIGNF
jgi:hypothetical protein